MQAFIWKYFPVFYTLPFLLATSRFEQLAIPSELLRWLTLAAGCGLALIGGLSRCGYSPGTRTSVDVMVLAFIGAFAASYAWSIAPSYSLQRAISLLLLYGCTMWAFWHWADVYSEEQLFRQILGTLLVVVAANLVVGSALYPEELLQVRFQGLFANPNNLGMLAGVAIPLSIAFWLTTNQRLYLAVAVLLLVNVVLCGTRSAMLGAGLSGLILAWTFIRTRPNLFILTGIAALAGGTFLLGTEFFQERILREDTLETASNRTYFWELAKEYIARRPLEGHGFGTDMIIHDHYGVVLSDLKLRGAGVMSSYYGLAVAMGWPVTLAFIGLMGLFVFRGVRMARTDPYAGIYAASLLSGLIVCIFEPALFSAGNCFSFLFWLVFAMLARRLYYRKLMAAGAARAGSG